MKLKVMKIQNVQIHTKMIIDELLYQIIKKNKLRSKISAKL